MLDDIMADLQWDPEDVEVPKAERKRKPRKLVTIRPKSPWQQLGVQMLNTLAANPDTASLFRGSPSDLATAPARSAAGSAAAAMSREAIRAEIERGSDPYARPVDSEDARPQVMLQPGFLIPLVALARSFGSLAAMKARTRPGEVLLLEVWGEEHVRTTAKLCRKALLPLLETKARNGGITILELTERALRKEALSEETRMALSSGAPVIVIAPADLPIPRTLRQRADHSFSVTPFDQESLTFLLRLSHSVTGTVASAALKKLLPEDAALRTLKVEDLELSLRKPTSLQVAADIHRALPKKLIEGDFSAYPLAPKARAAAQRLITDLEAWKSGALDWDDCLRGVVLHGPPGTGKTDFARVLAAHAKLPLIEAGPSKAQGAGSLHNAIRSMNDAMARAKQTAPSILFLDEVDAIGNRNRRDHNSAYTDGLVAAYLALLDGVGDREGVVVIAATNHLHNVDPALIRAGRFDLHIRLDPPSSDLLPQVFRWHLRDDLPDADLSSLRSLAMGRSPAECAAVVRDARAQARQERRPMRLADIEAILSAGLGAMSVEERRRIAVHEAGHAVAMIASRVGAVESMTINPSGGMVVRHRTEGFSTARDIQDEISTLLSGFAAEQLVLGEASLGSGGNTESDLARATSAAAVLESSTGLGSSGLLWSGPPEEARALLRTDFELSERVTAHLNRGLDQAKEIIRKHRALHTALSDALFNAGHLTQEQVAEIAAEFTDRKA
ncbi:MAG: AAA family ATPase [Fuscovulum sp.]|nr:MAG: AAA family ATPase [Fuscovulum sp.]